MRKQNDSKKSKVRREQPRKDSRAKRVNFDNERITKFDKDMRQDEVEKSKSNDVSWYAHNPEMLRAAASIPFNDVIGSPLTYDPGFSIPGIMRILWMPNFGGIDSPINQAANLMYSDTVHANSRNKSYDASDEMLLCLAAGQAFSAIAMGIRAYGTMRRFNQQDRYTPEALVRAMGFDYDNLVNNLANMWFDLNNLVMKSTQLWVPNLMPLIQRWYWMNSNIYRDGASIKSQYYMYVQTVFYKYSETAVNTGGSLQPVVWYSLKSDVVKTWSDYLSLANGLLDALINSQDRGIIFGDILKAYGADKLYRMAPITADYSIEPVYDIEVLSQFENVTTFSYINDDAGYGPLIQKQTGTAPTLFFAPFKVASAASDIAITAIIPAPNDLYINFHQKEAPTPDQIMVASRMMVAGIANYGNYTIGNQIYYGIGPAVAASEIPLRCDVIYYAGNASTGAWAPYYYTVALNQARPEDDSTVKIPDATMFMWGAFDWQPGINITKLWSWKPGTLTGNVAFPTLAIKITDYDNFAHLDAQVTLRKMHTTAMYSLFGVPYFTSI